jgi:SAM-dependent methyltransferase
MDWFKKWFSNKLYLELYSRRNDEEARTLINLIQRKISFPAGAKALDICCGSGRHSIELAKRGFDVTGFDASRYLISEAKKSAKEIKDKDVKVKFITGDMREFDYKESIHLSINIFTSFSYFKDDAENFSVFRNAYISLRYGGWFVFDFLNADYLKKHLVPETKTKINGNLIVQKRRIDNGFVIKDIYTGTNKKPEYSEVLKLYDYASITRELQRIGFENEFVFGDYYGNKFSKDKSERLIIFARKI